MTEEEARKQDDYNKRTDRSIKRLQILNSGKSIKCPLCKKGEVRKIKPALYLCDNCGRGIIS